MTELMTHYLQVRWHEQYMICERKKQDGIHTLTLRKRAVEDVKSDIKYDSCCNDSKQLSANILKAYSSLQKKLKEKNAQWEKDHPIVIDERNSYENRPAFR
jgi:hypothetical protein